MREQPPPANHPRIPAASLTNEVGSIDGLDDLEAALREMIALQGELASLLERKREAIRLANATALDAVIRAEAQCIDRIHRSEQRRAEAAAAVGRAIGIDTAVAPNLRSIALHLPEDRARALLDLGERIREKVEAIRREGSVIRTAADALGAQIASVLGVVRSALCNSRLYERRGRLAQGTQVMSTVDVVS